VPRADDTAVVAVLKGGTAKVDDLDSAVTRHAALDTAHTNTTEGSSSSTDTTMSVYASHHQATQTAQQPHACRSHLTNPWRAVKEQKPAGQSTGLRQLLQSGSLVSLTLLAALLAASCGPAQPAGCFPA
jgi:hypothetical protein